MSKPKTSLYYPLFCLVFTALVGALGSCTHSRSHKISSPASTVAIPAPSQKAPEMSEAAIQTSLAHYSIAMPENVNWHVETALKERGQTRWRIGRSQIDVAIGPAAFASWALLGSTLAHEMEVHCQQDLTAIAVLDGLGLPAKSRAEEEAYSYEVSQAKRFGLSAEELQSIQQNLNLTSDGQL